jgi:nitrogenase molybdenum-iron protein alpha/beta subunit
VDVMDMVAFVVGASSQSCEADMSEAMKRQFQRPVFDIMSTTLSALQ